MSIAQFQRIDILDEARHATSAGARLEAIRKAAPRLRELIGSSGKAAGVRTYDLITFPYPTKFGLGGASLLPLPYVMMRNRMQIVQFELGGELKTLLVNPTDYERSQYAPFFQKQAEMAGDFLSKKVLSQRHGTIEKALYAAGLRPEDVDYITFDHLHVQDVRGLLGTADGSVKPLLPNAVLLAQREEIGILKHLHPLQRPWYVADGLKGVDTARIVPLMGDYLLGPGVALVRTPGHTVGNHTPVLHTDSGLWTISENGVCVDCYSPYASELPGLRRHAAYYEVDVIMNSNSRELSLEQYNSMILEKALADPCADRPEFPQHFSSSETAAHPLAPGPPPTDSHGAITHGVLRRPGKGASAAA